MPKNLAKEAAGRVETFTVTLYGDDQASIRVLMDKLSPYNVVDKSPFDAGVDIIVEVESSRYPVFLGDMADLARKLRPTVMKLRRGEHGREIKLGGSSAGRVADAFLATSKQAYDEGGRSPYGYDPGHVTPFQPTVGEGSQVPFARDHQGKPVAPPDLGELEIPGYEWHDTSKAFHQVVMKNARGETMKLGINVKSFQERKEGWWDDFVALVREYWSFQEVKLRKGRGEFMFEVQQMGTLRVEVRGPANKPTVRVLGKGEKQFDDDASLWDILMWIDGVSRNGFTASTKSASDITLTDVAEEVTRANEVLRDAADMLDARVHGPSLADTYREAAEVSRALRSSTSRELAGMAAKLESAGRGRTASGGIDLAKEMRVLQRNVTDLIQTELDRVRDMVVRQFRANGFLAGNVRIAPDRSGWLNVEGQIVDDADTWRSRDDVDALFMAMFDTYGQLSGSAPNWKFTMGGFQSFGIAASTDRTASYDKGVYNLMERAHAAIKEAYPDTDDEHILKVVGPWFAGLLYSDKIPRSRFAPDGGKKLLRILMSLH